MLNFLILITAVGLLESCVTGKIEEPKFKVIIAESQFEIREYEPRMVAETIVRGSFKEAPNIGFRRLADYIFGNNTKQTKIAMTAPVAQEIQSEKIAMTAPVSQVKGEGNQWLITFTMPSQYTLENLPKPNNDLVSIRSLPSAKFAVVSFSGLNRQNTVIEKTASLRAWLQGGPFKEKGAEPIYARYDPPWTPWFWRRNEIQIEVQ
jgi:hypothetical protein